MASNTVSLRTILARFSDARCVLACAVQSLDRHDDVTQEQTCLQHGLRLLDGVYDDLDRAIAAGGVT
jgi:hypothetical protein